MRQTALAATWADGNGGRRKGPSYVSSMKCRNQQPSTEALLMLTSRLEFTAQQFSQSEYQSIRDKSEGMKLLAEEVRQEIDRRISI